MKKPLSALVAVALLSFGVAFAQQATTTTQTGPTTTTNPARAPQSKSPRRPARPRLRPARRRRRRRTRRSRRRAAPRRAPRRRARRKLPRLPSPPPSKPQNSFELQKAPVLRGFFLLRQLTRSDIPEMLRGCSWRLLPARLRQDDVAEVAGSIRTWVAAYRTLTLAKRPR